ncbi:GNAT family N-acetyltransferase [Sediminibacillus halophilus]|uniref:Acetyltransferase (GNAT) domain-containing protein n=1 Tax=Sediminibacillus halophilus TaxID=482461 RepID=A0A1G9N5D1_9BACI|nr:GNAT family N-acetyltransferase [Sediminibacillus halophilus]SDL81752.1 Acetyltransferase (GNAT) domain-containing protein [Sediminibacillus halophilus]
MKVKQIEPERTYLLRHQILRPNQSILQCQYPNDFQQGSFHLGAYLEGELISIASFYPEKHQAFSETRQYRLRGMATLEAYRSQRAGTALIQYGESLMKQKSASLWWCNARTTVSDYYLKMGMDFEGEVFDIEPIGPHRLMFKRLG